MTINKQIPIPFYFQIKTNIKRRIENKSLKPLARILPELELVKEYRVSRGTVRQALSELVSEGLLQRIPGKGTFVIDTHNLESGKGVETNLLGIIAPGFVGLKIMEIIRGIEKVIRDKNKYNLIFCDTDNNSCLEAKRVEEMIKKGVKGLIIWLADDYDQGRFRSKHILRLKEKNFPFVLVDRYIREINTDYVVSDNLWVSCKAVKQLIKSGHRRIAHISMSNIKNCSSLQDRLEGYKKALAEREDNLIRIINEDNYRQVIGALLEIKNAPTAIFAGSGGATSHILKALTEKDSKKKIKAIAGFDFDGSVIGNSKSFSYIDINQPFYEMGKMAAQIVIDKIEKGAGVKQIFLKPKIEKGKRCS